MPDFSYLVHLTNFSPSVLISGPEPFVYLPCPEFVFPLPEWPAASAERPVGISSAGCSADCSADSGPYCPVGRYPGCPGCPDYLGYLDCRSACPCFDSDSGPGFDLCSGPGSGPGFGPGWSAIDSAVVPAYSWHIYNFLWPEYPPDSPAVISRKHLQRPASPL